MKVIELPEEDRCRCLKVVGTYRGASKDRAEAIAAEREAQIAVNTTIEELSRKHGVYEATLSDDGRFIIGYANKIE